jgi:hypothetical protein
VRLASDPGRNDKNQELNPFQRGSRFLAGTDPVPAMVEFPATVIAAAVRAVLLTKIRRFIFY